MEGQLTCLDSLFEFGLSVVSLDSVLAIIDGVGQVLVDCTASFCTEYPIQKVVLIGTLISNTVLDIDNALVIAFEVVQYALELSTNLVTHTLRVGRIQSLDSFLFTDVSGCIEGKLFHAVKCVLM